MLGRGGDAAAPQPLGEGNRGGRDPRGGRAETAFGLGDRAAGTSDVEHRREVDVDTDVAQVGGRGTALTAAEPGAAGAHLARPRPLERRRSASPARPPGRPSPAAGRAAPAGRGIACRRRARRRRRRGWAGSRRRGSPRRPRPRGSSASPRRELRCRQSRRRCAGRRACERAAARRRSAAGSGSGRRPAPRRRRRPRSPGRI